MPKKKKIEIGSIAFLFGIGLAIITGFLESSILITGLLVIAGLAVGFLNITEKETTSFLLACLALIAAGSANIYVLFSAVPTLAIAIRSVLNNIIVFVAPAAIIVALKAIYNLASRK